MVFKDFLGELKRRQVIRVGGVYAVAAWGVFSVADKILETLNFPSWVSTLVRYGAGIWITTIVLSFRSPHPRFDNSRMRTDRPDIKCRRRSWYIDVAK